MWFKSIYGTFWEGQHHKDYQELSVRNILELDCVDGHVTVHI